MRRLFVSVTAVVTVGATGSFGGGVASAEDSQAGWTADHGAPTTDLRRWGRLGAATRSAVRTCWAFPTTSTSCAPEQNGSPD